ncbi:hypothetical protein IY145_23840 [Methylosinus sp. H3A]|nr:hypothetical protein [Methylosinus sp. H3A]
MSRRSATKCYDLCADDPHGLAGVAKRAEEVPRPSRDSSADELAGIIGSFAELAEEARTLRYTETLSENISGYAHQNDGHTKQEAKRSIEDCNQRSDANASQHPHEKRASGATFDASREEVSGTVRKTEQHSVTFELAIPKDLSLWREACPEIESFAPVRSIEEASATGATLIKACGLARHAYEDAIHRLGALNAGLLALFVYQRHADGERPGGTPSSIAGRPVRHLPPGSPTAARISPSICTRCSGAGERSDTTRSRAARRSWPLRFRVLSSQRFLRSFRGDVGPRIVVRAFWSRLTAAYRRERLPSPDGLLREIAVSTLARVRSSSPSPSGGARQAAGIGAW